MKRRTDEIIILAMSAICAAGLAPFAVIRFMIGDWHIALIDSVGFLFVSLNGIFVYRTRNVHRSGIALSVIAVTGIVLSINLDGTGNVYFLHPVLVASFYLMKPRQALGLSTLAVVVISPGVLSVLTAFEYLRVLFSLLGCILFAYVFASQSKKQRDQLLAQSTQDALTGAGNRRGLDEKLEQVMQSHARTSTNMSLILLDFDRFKEVNDNYGHVVGDDLLIRITRVIQTRIRSTDDLYRYGGDEFIILAASADLDTASRLAEDLRALVEADASVSGFNASISLGVAEYLAEETRDQWVGRADAALLTSKRSGRNQVVSSHGKRSLSNMEVSKPSKS